MLRLRLERVYNNPKGKYCIGKLYINDVRYCDTLEPTDRGLYDSMSNDEIKGIKIKGDTAIGTGIYNVILAMSPSFRRKLPLLEKVKGFKGILIHRGNYPRDTSGCILLGENKKVGMVINPTGYEDKIVMFIRDELNKEGGKVQIEIIRKYAV